ncbi:hypothetical protein ACSBR1_034654 [Camellia fascicularis]
MAFPIALSFWMLSSVKSLQSYKGPQPYSSNTTYKSYIKLVEKSSSSSTSKLQEPREKWQLHEILQSEKRHFLSAILHKIAKTEISNTQSPYT